MSEITRNKTTVPLFNVVATNIKTGARRTIAANKTERNAEAIVSMTVARRGVEEEFFATELVRIGNAT